MSSAPNLQLFVNSRFLSSPVVGQSRGFDGGASSMKVSGAKFYPLPTNSEPTQFMVFWVLSRLNPEAEPVFSMVASDTTSVPQALEPYMTTQYILVAAQSAYVGYMPQGELYKFLRKNGADSALKRCEACATNFADGVSGGMVYQLISIPGGGPGIESVEFRGSAISTTDPGPGASAEVDWQTRNFISLVELIPSQVGGKTYYEPTHM